MEEEGARAREAAGVGGAPSPGWGAPGGEQDGFHLFASLQEFLPLWAPAAAAALGLAGPGQAVGIGGAAGTDLNGAD